MMSGRTIGGIACHDASSTSSSANPQATISSAVARLQRQPSREATPRPGEAVLPAGERRRLEPDVLEEEQLTVGPQDPSDLPQGADRGASTVHSTKVETTVSTDPSANAAAPSARRPAAPAGGCGSAAAQVQLYLDARRSAASTAVTLRAGPPASTSCSRCNHHRGVERSRPLQSVSTPICHSPRRCRPPPGRRTAHLPVGRTRGPKTDRGLDNPVGCHGAQVAARTKSATGLSCSTCGMRRVSARGPSNVTCPARIAWWRGVLPSQIS